MLGYMVRTLPVFIGSKLSGQRLISDTSWRVWPWQIDINLHMNQAVYAQTCELARVDWVLRSGAWDRWKAAGINPVVADQRITYRRELKPLAGYKVDCRAVGMEGRLLKLEHYVLVKDRVHAHNMLTMIFVGPDGVLSAQDAETCCEGLMVPPLQVEDWRVTG